jgi:integrase
LPGRRERVRRGGYLTRREAVAARDALLGDGNTATAEGWTVERWLRYGLTTRTGIRPTTLRSYQTHVDNQLIPYLGRIRLSDLAGRHITDMITAVAVADNRYGRAPTPSTLYRIRATLRSALNAAIREGLLRDNPARYVEVPSPRRPHALVWTAQRVQAWQQTGERPSVAVWTTEQSAAFLRFVAQDRLAVMWWLIALRGLRRGEAAGLRHPDVDLDAGVAMISFPFPGSVVMRRRHCPRPRLALHFQPDPRLRQSLAMDEVCAIDLPKTELARDVDFRPDMRRPSSTASRHVVGFWCEKSVPNRRMIADGSRSPVPAGHSGRADE